METKRSILEKVKDGTLSPEEAAAELDELESHGADPDPAEGPTLRKTIRFRHQKVEPSGDAPPEGPAKRIRIIGDFRTAKVAGDSSVAEAVVEGDHSARREGDTLVIDASGDGENGEGDFAFRRGDRPRIVIGMGSRSKPIAIRMNPDLPLEVEIDAGKVSIAGVRASIKGKLDAGAIKIEDVESPFQLSVDAGSIRVGGLLREGNSSIRCDAGSVKVMLRKGSSVKVRAHADIGSVKLGSRGLQGFQVGGSTQEVTFGAGDALLDITGSLGRIVVDEE